MSGESHLLTMRRPLALVISLLMASLALTGCLGSDEFGFSANDLTAPELATASIELEDVPEADMMYIGMEYALSWKVSEVNQCHTAAVKIFLENKGLGDIFVDSISWTWADGGSFERDVAVTVSPGEEAMVGKLLFTSQEAGEQTYSVGVGMLASNLMGTRWYDHGIIETDEHEIDVIPLGTAVEYNVTSNPRSVYDDINSLVDFETVDSAVDMIINEHPGEYSIIQVVAAYEWVEGNIEYVLDVGDHWQSAEETLLQGYGDCEDQAILLASIVTALGGTARVNIMEQHAFPTVYVGDDNGTLEGVRACLSSYYDADVEVCFLEDGYGYWMVIDTNGIPYAGGLPPLSVSTEDGWGFLETDYLYPIDVTGEPSPDGISLFGL
jgi:hypothetical protein